MRRPTLLIRYILIILFSLSLTEIHSQSYFENYLPKDYSIRYVNTDRIAVLKQFENQNDVIDYLTYLEKIVVIDEFVIDQQAWFKIIYPTVGYIKSDYLITEKELDKIRNLAYYLHDRIDYSTLEWAIAEVPEDFKSENDGSIISSEDKSLIESDGRKFIVYKNNYELFDKDEIEINWCDSVDINNNGYYSSSNLCVSFRSKNPQLSRIAAKIFIREKADSDYSLYRKTDVMEYPADVEQITFKLGFGGDSGELDNGEYSFQIEYYDVDRNKLIALLNNHYDELNSQSFESAGEDKDEDFVVDEEAVQAEEDDDLFSSDEDVDHNFSLFGTYAFYTKTVEDVFESKDQFWGGGFEYSRSDFYLGLGVGYAEMKNAMSMDSTFLSTKLYKVYAKVFYLKLLDYYWGIKIDPNLEVYSDIGATFWETKFQKRKYDNIKKDYHLEMDKKGNGYFFGFGVRYHFYNIIIGLNYDLYHSSESEFSKSVEYTTFDGQKFDVIDKYNLYTGFQQIKIHLGYRIQL